MVKKIIFNLRLFEGPANVTIADGMSVEMKTYYDRNLIENAEPKLIYDQLAQQRDIPRNGGKTIGFRKYDQLPKALTPLTEGVTPKGQKMNVTKIEATVKQHGGFIGLTDLLKKIVLNLRLFEGPANVTTADGMSVEMKTYYDRNLIENAEPKLVHDQWAQQRDIPKNGGKTIEFRKYDQLPKALTPLTEGVTPQGQAMNVTKIEATVKQYGGFIELSDLLIMTAIDNNIVEATTLIGSQAGRTLDTISREVMNAGTNVQYAEGQVKSRAAITKDMKLTPKAIKMAVRTLKKQNAERIGGYYYSIIHPDCSFDLTESDRFIEAVKYKNPERIYNGEIGEFEGVRFVETTEAKIFAQAGAQDAENGNKKVDVYSTLVFGSNAYATTKIQGGGLETIIKQLGSSGTADALNQRATVGWKALKVTELLSPQYMVRIETASTFSDGVAN